MYQHRPYFSCFSTISFFSFFSSHNRYTFNNLKASVRRPPKKVRPQKNATIIKVSRYIPNVPPCPATAAIAVVSQKPKNRLFFSFPVFSFPFDDGGVYALTDSVLPDNDGSGAEPALR